MPVKQKPRSEYTCGSRADHTILVHLCRVASDDSRTLRWTAAVRWFRKPGRFRVEISRLWYSRIEKQSMLAAKQARKAKTVTKISETRAAIQQQVQM